MIIVSEERYLELESSGYMNLLSMTFSGEVQWNQDKPYSGLPFTAVKI
jgi:hypothetical protein